jgi:hypothetical protein
VWYELCALWAGKAAPMLVGCHARHRERVLCRAAPRLLAQFVLLQNFGLHAVEAALGMELVHRRGGGLAI